MAYQCELKEQPRQFALSVRTRKQVQDLPGFFGKSYGDIGQHLGELGEPPAGPPFAAYYNMDMQNLDVEAGFPVSRAMAGKGDIQPSEIPGGKVATCVHVGPYTELKLAYEALSEWIKEQGHEPAGVAYEIYLNDPNETPPQKLATQIVFPLKGG